MTSTGISSRYAHAYVEALIGPTSGVEAYGSVNALRDFVNTMHDSHDLELVLLSPSVSPQRKRAVIGKIADAMQLDRLLKNFLLVLSDHRRLPLLKEISEIASVFLLERLGFLRADVFAAAPLSSDQQNQIAEELGRRTGKQIRMDVKVDPELIGGVVARVGSTVYDGSVRGRLRAMGERLAADSI